MSDDTIKGYPWSLNLLHNVCLVTATKQRHILPYWCATSKETCVSDDMTKECAGWYDKRVCQMIRQKSVSDDTTEECAGWYDKRMTSNFCVAKLH